MQGECKAPFNRMQTVCKYLSSCSGVHIDSSSQLSTCCPKPKSHISMLLLCVTILFHSLFWRF